MQNTYQQDERDLLRIAIKAANQETGLQFFLEKKPEIAGERYDAALRVEGYEQIKFVVVVKKWVQQTNFGALVEQIKKLPLTGLLVADYINPNMAEKLKNHKVPFIDMAGNIYINEKPLYIFVKGNKPTKNEWQQAVIQKQKGNRAFQPTGLKVLYAFLTNPDILNAPYREIANITGVALGTVGWVINDLKDGRFLVEYERHNRRLRNIKKLLDKWVDAYLEKLRPKLFVGTFAADDDYWFLDVDEGIVEYGARWGGETAAAKLTGHLKPEITTVYLPKDGNTRFLVDNNFRKDPKGNIEVYKAFWDIDDFHFDMERPDLTDIVHPLIVYADLLARADPRNLETARIVYDKELVKLIRED